MIGELVKRVVNLVVVALAAIAFFCVPLGDKTLFRHLSAIFATKEAGDLGRELRDKGSEVASEVKREAVKVAAPLASAHGHDAGSGAK